VHLAHKVGVMLAGQPGIALIVAAFAVGAMTGCAAPGVEFSAVVEIAPLSLCPRPDALEPRDVAATSATSWAKIRDGKSAKCSMYTSQRWSWR